MQTAVAQQKLGEAPADFALRTLDSRTATLGSVLEGKSGAVIVIWSSTCSHCLRYDKYFNNFTEKRPELGLLVIGSRQGETFEALALTARQRKLQFPLAHDPGGEVAGKWFTRQTPRAFLLDGNGSLLYRGAIDNYKYPEDPEYVAYLEPAIQQFLGGKPIEKSETASYGCAIQSVYYILPKVL